MSAGMRGHGQSWWRASGLHSPGQHGRMAGVHRVQEAGGVGPGVSPLSWLCRDTTRICVPTCVVPCVPSRVGFF